MQFEEVNSGERIKIFGSKLVPYFDILYDYTWVGDLLKKRALEVKLKEAMDTIKTIDRLPPARAEFLETCRRSWSEDRPRARVDALAKFLSQNMNNPTPLKRILRLSPFLVNDCTLEEVEAAVALLPEQLFGPANADRVKKRAAAAKAAAQCETQIAALVPPPYLTVGDDGKPADIRELFVEFWLNRQWTVGEAIGPQGFAITSCPPEEQAAYAQLEIVKALSPKKKGLAALR